MTVASEPPFTGHYARQAYAYPQARRHLVSGDQNFPEEVSR